MVDPATWLARLVSIPSVTPTNALSRPELAGEGRIAAAVADWFRALGAEVIIDEVLPGRPNVYGIWRGRSDRWLGLDAHLDTVGVDQMPGDPFSGAIQDGRVYGRGAVDTKASLGVALAVLEELQQAGKQLDDTLLVAATVDEEVGATGAPAFARWAQQRQLHFDQLMVAEPTRCAPVYGHTGVVRLELSVQGIAAHSSQPRQGKNAVSAAAQIVLGLDQEYARLLSLPPTPLGHGALSVTLISGGRGINIIPDTCRLSLDRRLVVGERPAAVQAALIDLILQTSSLPVEAETLLAHGPFWQEPSDPWVQQLATWGGRAAEVAGYGTNAYAYPEIANACVVLGPGSIDQAHGSDEWVEVAELERLAAIYRRWWGVG
jgi:acetylornithine deacetylase/succinyl-diaminopimelate desuccinylase-like protein